MSIECFYYGTISSFPNNIETLLTLTRYLNGGSYPLIDYCFVDNILYRKASFIIMQKFA